MSIVDSWGYIQITFVPEMSELTIFHSFSIRWGVHSDIKASLSNSNGPDGKIFLRWVYLLDIFRPIDTSQGSRIVEQLSMELLDLKTLTVESLTQMVSQRTCIKYGSY
jgi:hypothetical protein